MDRTQLMILAVFAVLAALPFLLLSLGMWSKRRRQRRAWRKRWREQLAAPTEEVEELILGCDILDARMPRGLLRDDPEVARFLDLVRSHQHRAAAEYIGGSLEALLWAAGNRMGWRDRPLVMDYPYLDEVLAELVRRTRAPVTPYR